MPELRSRMICGLQELLDIAEPWNDLWQRSEVAVPTSQAEHIALWVRRFSRDADFKAMVVEDEQGTLLASLPLVSRRLAKMVPVAGLPAGEWSPGGDLLLDPTIDGDPVIDTLIHGLRRAPWQMLWLDGLRTDTARWQAFLRAAQRANLQMDFQPQYSIGYLSISPEMDWDDFKATRSRNLRKSINKCKKRLEKQGELKLVRYREFTAEQIPQLLRRGLEVENRSWKGADGTSVLQSEGMPEFFEEQACILAKRGELELSFLELAGKPIAFEMGYYAKCVYHSFKIGYDDAFAEFSPGQLLLAQLLQVFFNDNQTLAMDCLGPIGAAAKRWHLENYTEGRLVLALQPLVGRAVLEFYRHGWTHLKEVGSRCRVGSR